jgi:hypothetical protein
MGFPRRKGPTEPVRSIRRTGQPGPRFNYELFNGNNFNIRYWSWNYRGCWPFSAPSPGGFQRSRPRTLSSLYMMGAPAEDILSNGKARPLSHLPGTGRVTHTFARSTRAVWESLPRGSARDYHGLLIVFRLPRSRLCRRHPPITVTDTRLVGVTLPRREEPYYLWRQQNK